MDDPDGLIFDLAVYSLDCIKRAAYRFSDRFSLNIRIDDQRAVCSLRFSATVSPDSKRLIIQEFEKELLDQDLRESVRVETKDVRNLILAHAFSRTGLIGDVSVPTD